MANSFTKTRETVAGSFRIIVGTLDLADGSGGLIVPTGLNQVFQVVGSSSQTSRLTFTAGGIHACTASSGASYQVVVFGC